MFRKIPLWGTLAVEGTSLWGRHFSVVGGNGNRVKNVLRQKKVTRRGDGKCVCVCVCVCVCTRTHVQREISQRQEAGA